MPSFAVRLGRTVNQMPFFVKPGAVARAVIAFLRRVPLQPAAHVGTVGNDPSLSGRQKMLCQSFHRISAMHSQPFRRLRRKTSGQSRPVINAVRIRALTMEEVMPHFPKPVATYQYGLRLENLPI